MDDRDATAPALCCVLLTSDVLLAVRARLLCKQRHVPLLAVDTVEAVRGILVSVIPSHLVLDARHGEAVDPELLLGRLRPAVQVVHVHGLDSALDVLAAIAGP